MNEQEYPDDRGEADRFPLSMDDLMKVQKVIKLVRDHLAHMTPAHLRATATVLFALERLPSATPGIDVDFSFEQPNEDGNWGWADITISEEEFSLGLGEHFYDPCVGGDTETRTAFEARAGQDWSNGEIDDWLPVAKVIASEGQISVQDSSDHALIEWDRAEGPGDPTDDDDHKADDKATNLTTWASERIQTPDGRDEHGRDMSFDPGTYAKAKPLFLKVAAEFVGSWNDVAELARKLVRELRAAGFSMDVLRNMRPYLDRFLAEVRTGTINLPKVSKGPINFEIVYLQAMRDQAPAMFTRLSKSGQLENQAKIKAREANRMLKDLLEQAPRENGRPTMQAQREAEEIVRAELLQFEGPDQSPEQEEYDALFKPGPIIPPERTS